MLYDWYNPNAYLLHYYSWSIDDVSTFLQENNLNEFVEIFRKNEIDGEILEAILSRNNEVKGDERTVAEFILKEELGVKKGPQRLRIKSKFKSRGTVRRSVALSYHKN